MSNETDDCSSALGGDVSLRRLIEIAAALEISVDELSAAPNTSEPADLAAEGKKLLEAYLSIKSETLRRSIYAITSALALQAALEPVSAPAGAMAYSHELQEEGVALPSL